MIQGLFGSVRRSLVLRPNPGGNDPGGEGIAEKIGSCLRKSRVGLGLGFGLSAPKLPPPPAVDDAPPIRWRKGELIGCGAFGHVYMGMNLDSGELLAVKQVLVATSSASKAKAQAHIRELEEEVKLLKNLSHPNIVRYLGTVREEETLNILLEFVSGGSISSLLGKFGSFPEAVIRMYTKQILQGLEYLHRNGIIHRDIKGANILVDNKGCIKLADFGASKQVAKLATMNAAKSMKGTPYWMAPEVILQTGHNFSADIWSVGCTIIEMATGKPPWSQQFQEVAALFHIGTTKSHPQIPEHLSPEAHDFLLKCLQKEPNARHSASELLQHPFVTKEFQDIHPLYRSTVMEPSKNTDLQSKLSTTSFGNPMAEPTASCEGYGDLVYGSGSCSTSFPKDLSTARPLWAMNSSDDMCQLGDIDDFPVVGRSFNPISEPSGNWSCKFDNSPEQRTLNPEKLGESTNYASTGAGGRENKFAFPCEPVFDDEEVTESKIRAFLDEKALDLKKLQTPLYEEFFNSLNNTADSCSSTAACEETINKTVKLPPENKISPNKASGISAFTDTAQKMSPGNCSRRVSSSGMVNNRILREVPSPQLNVCGVVQDAQQEQRSPSCIANTETVSEMRRKWKEELDQELEREREMMRQAAGFGKASSPLERCPTRKRDRLAGK